ncbi:MAG: Grx4 family monothiol glutaredoxin [Rickettsiales bacterium]
MLDIEIANNFIKDINTFELSSDEVHIKIANLLKDNPIVLFMKGIKDFPACGFSAKVVYILNQYNTPYITIDVLQSSTIRDEIKKFSDWLTIPQLYIKEKFIGGCDIVSKMHENNKLKSLLEEFMFEDKDSLSNN